MLVTDYLDFSAANYPDKIAFSCDSESMTFGELYQFARKTAMGIIEYGIMRSPIVVFLDKTPTCTAVFQGIAYSGNFYTPVDTRMPALRIKKILETLNPALIITDSRHMEKAKEFSGETLVVLCDDLKNIQIDDKKINAVTAKITDADVLYVIFTSGSTGVPKGVIIPHRSVIDYIDWFTEQFDITEKDIFGNQAPLHFDLSIQDVYVPLKTGCTTYLIEKEYFRFPIKLMEYLYVHNINIIMWVPSAICLVAALKGLRAKNLPKLKMVLFCGEVMPNKQLNMWRRTFPETVFVNLYGPSETCDASAFYIVDREFEDSDPLPIGYPCKNTDIFVLNDNDKIVQENEIGELCIRGSSLSYGYYHDIEKTKEVFTQNPLHHDYPDIIYRTGDLVRYNSYGELEYVSRKDFQIKHLGHRIELGEIENAASALEGVERCCCYYDEGGDKIILFYSGKRDENQIINSIERILPHYMMPYKVVCIDEMPVNQNGKIDREEIKKLWV